MAIEMNDFAIERMRDTVLRAQLNGGTITIYSGTIPSDVSTFVPATHAGNLLLEYTGVSVADNSALQYLYLSSLPTATASATGTASWFAIRSASNADRAVLGDVTDEAGNGALRLLSTSITSGNSVQIQNFSIKIASAI